MEFYFMLLLNCNLFAYQCRTVQILESSQLKKFSLHFLNLSVQNKKLKNYISFGDVT